MVSACGATDAEPPTHEAVGGQALPAALPSEAASLAARFDIPIWVFGAYSDEVLSAVSVVESEVSPYTDYPSDSEHANAAAVWRADCYTQAGFPASVEPPGSKQVVYRGSNAPTMSENLDVQLCDLEAVLRFPPRPVPTSEEEWRFLYERKLAEAECLELQGHSIPNVPTFDAFRDNQGRWDPFGDLPDEILDDEWNRLIVDCAR